MDRFILAAVAAVAVSAGSARAEFIIGLTSGNTLVRFDSSTPGVIQSAAISGTGTNPGDAIVAIDYRPANGFLYGVTGNGGLFMLDALTGVATFAAQLMTAPNTPLRPGNAVGGFDFNPMANALRIITTQDDNYRVTTAGVNGTGATLTDVSIMPSSLSLVGSAYTNNVPGATVTTLYGLNASGNLLITGTGGANGGMYNPVGSLGLGTLGDNTGFDISGVTGTAYASANLTGAVGTGLYRINLATGTATSLGTIGSMLTVVDIAAPVGQLTAVPAPVPATLPLALLGAASAVGFRRLRRSC